MSRAIRARGRARAGLTIVEVTIASATLAILWVSLASALQSGVRSQEALVRQADRIEELRRADDSLRADLHATSAGRMSAQTLEDGRYVLELQHPIQVEGADAWGVRDSDARADAETNGFKAWRIRYVADGGQTGGDVPLRRQLLDEEDEVQGEQVVASLGRDEMGSPGFRVDTEGEMASIHILRSNHGTGAQCQETSFHVRIRN